MRVGVGGYEGRVWIEELVVDAACVLKVGHNRCNMLGECFKCESFFRACLTVDLQV